jgi:hypothetical protein
MRVLATVVPVIAATGLWAAQIHLARKARPTPGEWSAQGVYLGYGLGALDYPGQLKVSRVPSPDSEKAVVFEHLLLTVESKEKKLPGSGNWRVTSLSEVLCSPDSSAFSITQSEGGWVGDWHVHVFLVKDREVKQADLTQQARRDFATRYQCESPNDLYEGANMGAIAWVGGSQKLLVAAEVPPHSLCRDMGRVMGYLVSVPSGNILRRYTNRDVRARWGHFLGERLKAQ